MSSLDKLYDKRIVERYKNPKNFGEIEDIDFGFYARDNNESCGDEIEIYIQFDVSGEVIEHCRFSGMGCALSMVTADILCDILKGKTFSGFKEVFEEFKRLLKKEELKNPDLIGDLTLFKSVANYSIRQKCVLLPFHAISGRVE